LALLSFSSETRRRLPSWRQRGVAEVSPVDLPAVLGRRWRVAHRANISKTCYTSDKEEERPSPYKRTPMVPSLGSTARYLIKDCGGFSGTRLTMIVEALQRLGL
jgi:hypothetical protein